MMKFLTIFSLLILTTNIVIGANSEDSRTIRGVILYKEDNSPVVGATITSSSGGVGAVSGVDGDFSLLLPTTTPSINISYMGYESVEVALSQQQSYYEISIVERVSELDEVVVIGFGHARRSDVTGAIATIDAKQIENSSATSFDELLRGKVAGVQISSIDGSPGGAANIRIRGTGSINASADPLYVIDGVPMVFEDDGMGMNTNPLADINPDDIESMSILKDASASAIYGSRGANGVIVVTTKQAVSGKAKVSYAGIFSYSLLPNELSVLSAEEYMYFQNEKENRYPWVLSGNNIYGSTTWATYKAELAELGATDWSQTTNTNWQQAILQNAFTNKHQLRVTGGTKALKYNFNADYYNSEGAVKETGYSRFYARADVTAQINDRISFSTNTRFTRAVTDGKVQAEGNGTSSGGGIFIKALRYKPTIELDENIYFDEDSDLATGNPLTTLYESSMNKTKNIVTSSNTLNIEITKRIKFKSLFSAMLEDSKLSQFYSSQTQQAVRVGGSAKLGDISSTDLYSESLLTYNNKIKRRHSINAVGGITLQSTRNEKFYANAANFLFDDLEANNLALGANFVNPTSYNSKSTLLSGLVRVNYSYDNRYVLTASMRADGSSRFSDGNKWGYFPSAALAWNLSQEQFMPESNVVSNIKLRLSYGKTGNQEIGLYKSMQTYGAVDTSFDDYVGTGLLLSQISNDNLKWEVTTQYNAGLDISLFKSRVGIHLDTYYKSTTDLLLNVPVPSSSGFTTTFGNIGRIDNKGVEASLHVNVVNGSKDRLGVDFDFNIAFNDNKVVDLGYTDTFYKSLSYHGSASDQVIVTEGASLGSWYGYQCDGIFQYNDPDLDKFITVQGSAPTAGDWKYVDQNGDNIIDENDRVILGNSQPKFFGGFSTGFSYKDLSLHFMFDYSYGADVFNATKLIMTDMQSTGNLLSDVRDRWVGPDWQTYSNGNFIIGPDGKPLTVAGSGNASNTMPRAGYVSTYELQDSYIEDGSFLRLSTIKLTYNLPYRVCSKLRVGRISTWFAANNVWLLTNYSGSDPEVNMDPDGYGNIISGYDYDSYPRTTSFSLGVNIDF